MNGPAGRPVRAISFDLFGTLVELDRPFDRLRSLLEDQGQAVPLSALQEAFRAEMRFYRDHHLEGTNPTTIAALRMQCADVLFGRLAASGYAVPLTPQEQTALMLQAVVFTLHDDALPAIDTCRRAGLAVGLTSNWDCSVRETLASLGLGDTFDFMVISACEGIAKPDPQLFRCTCNAAGLPADAILHVGDEYPNDIVPALAAGCQAVLIERSPGTTQHEGTTIKSLAELKGI